MTAPLTITVAVRKQTPSQRNTARKRFEVLHRRYLYGSGAAYPLDAEGRTHLWVATAEAGGVAITRGASSESVAVRRAVEAVYFAARAADAKLSATG